MFLGCEPHPFPSRLHSGCYGTGAKWCRWKCSSLPVERHLRIIPASTRGPLLLLWDWLERECATLLSSAVLSSVQIMHLQCRTQSRCPERRQNYHFFIRWCTFEKPNYKSLSPFCNVSVTLKLFWLFSVDCSQDLPLRQKKKIWIHSTGREDQPQRCYLKSHYRDCCPSMWYLNDCTSSSAHQNTPFNHKRLLWTSMTEDSAIVLMRTKRCVPKLLHNCHSYSIVWLCVSWPQFCFCPFYLTLLWFCSSSVSLPVDTFYPSLVHYEPHHCWLAEGHKENNFRNFSWCQWNRLPLNPLSSSHK